MHTHACVALPDSYIFVHHLLLLNYSCKLAGNYNTAASFLALSKMSLYLKLIVFSFLILGITAQANCNWQKRKRTACTPSTPSTNPPSTPSTNPPSTSSSNNGKPGEPGEPGEPRIAGTPSTPGQMGAIGKQGEEGPTGAKGDTGPKGDEGMEGPTGAKGDIGPTGAKGPAGVNGPPGIQYNITKQQQWFHTVGKESAFFLS